LARRKLLGICLFSTGFALVVVILGAYTRLADAGLGCPDWPGCYGFLTVPDAEHEVVRAAERFPDAPLEQDKAWWEMIHRYFAGTLGLLILGIAAVAVVSARQQASDFQAGNQYSEAGQRLPLKLPLFLLLLVICQAAFGAWTVTLKLWPQVVTAHLLGGFATLSLLWLLCLRLGLFRGAWVPARLGTHALVALLVVVVQIALGGWVSSNYAALACPDFPTCHGDWWPAMKLSEGFNVAQSVGPNYLGGQLESDARVAIQFTHRLGALLVLLVVGALIWRLWQARSPMALPVAALLAGQILLGILNVVLMLPLDIATAHNAVGALLLASLVTVNYRAFRDGRKS
jgi:cytochrome c oxidase assembly protein subunit 15